MDWSIDVGASRRQLLCAALGVAGFSYALSLAAAIRPTRMPKEEAAMIQVTFTKTQAPAWLIGFWREIDDKTWGKGFDCFAEDAVCNLGVADWHGREAIRENLRKFIDSGFTAHHEVLEYWDSPHLKVFRGKVTMTPDNGGPVVHPTMTHFFYMDERSQSKVKHWFGAVGPVSFG
ncbi:nuclear transport factor 2 family protein [Sphingomonas sp. PAMC 26617]|uniref:nuclear transport factor 2 family protein n=1 Tax=Sphingomonas sp. PAMC 26617 TaxID=1112216 RepID=UPI0002893651|nr:nuclear transport factor 2 family protein [Sphingomonas sp. PAMC 26617]